MKKEKTLYLCDPHKNKECQKSSCQIKCKLTTNKEFAKTDENGKEIIHQINQKGVTHGKANKIYY